MIRDILYFLSHFINFFIKLLYFIKIIIYFNKLIFISIVENIEKVVDIYVNMLPIIYLFRFYRIDRYKYHLIMFTKAKIMEMTKEVQNQVALFLFNSINSEIRKKQFYRLNKLFNLNYKKS